MSQIQTFGLSFGMGLALFSFTMLLAWLSITYGWNANIFKYILLPTFGYGFALALNSILQYTTCSTVKIGQISIASIPILIAIGIALILTLLGPVRKPIESVFNEPVRALYGGAFAIAFYMFWAGMFGEAIASGMAQSC